MKNLRTLSKIFMYAAIVTFVVAWLIMIENAAGGIKLFDLAERVYLGMYVLNIIPVIFASMAVSLRFIAKAIDPDYQSEKRERREPPMVLPPE